MPQDRPAPSVDDVNRIAALPDPVLRNLQITQCYHDLSLAMADLTGPSANWCTLATWASKQAGQSIRKQDLARAFERLLDQSPDVIEGAEALASAADAPPAEVGPRSPAPPRERGLGDPALRRAVRAALLPSAAFERVSQAVARGNRKVFEEIGLAFARFLDLCARGPLTGEAIATLHATLRPGEPPDGQRYLRQAFTHYAAALAEPDAKPRAELMLLANLEIGYHEQTRLQPEIVAALDAPLPPVSELEEEIMQAIFPSWLVRLRLRLEAARGRLTGQMRARRRLAEEARRLAHVVVTDTLMTLDLPGRPLRLGRDLAGTYPESLHTIGRPDLQALLAQIDPTPDSLTGTGALDWGDLPDRLHLIVDLFRCIQEDARLFADPFDPRQAAEIRSGSLPDGRL